MQLRFDRTDVEEIGVHGLFELADLESYRIAVGYLPQSFGFPPGSTTGDLAWMAIEDVGVEELKGSPLGPLVITR